MNIKKWIAKSEQTGVAIFKCFIICMIIAFLLGGFTIISYTLPTSVLNPESYSGMITRYGAMIFSGISISSGLLGILIFLNLLFISPLTQKDKQKLRKNIAYHQAQINLLRSDKWNCIVKKSAGDNVNRITSQQFLIDERDNLIRHHQQLLDIAERQLDSSKK